MSFPTRAPQSEDSSTLLTFSRPGVELVCARERGSIEYLGEAYGKRIFFMATPELYVFCAADTIEIAACCARAVLRDRSLALTMSREFESFLIVGEPPHSGTMHLRVVHALLDHFCNRLKGAINEATRKAAQRQRPPEES